MAMTPAAARVIDPILSQIAQGYQHPGRVANVLFPRVAVPQSGGRILRFGKESFKLYNLRRAPGAQTARIEFGYASDPYRLVQDAVEVPVPRELVREAEQGPGIDLGERATRMAMDTITLALEVEAAQLATDPNQYDASHKVALSGTSKWSDYANSDPIQDIEDAKEAIRASVGLRPNVMVLGPKPYNALKHHPKLLERIKYSQRGIVTLDLLQAIFDIERVVVGEAIYADEAGNFVDVWGNNAILAYVPGLPAMEVPSYGYTYTLERHPFVEEPYFENSRKSWIYGVTYERAPVITSAIAGFLIQTPA